MWTETRETIDLTPLDFEIVCGSHSWVNSRVRELLFLKEGWTLYGKLRIVKNDFVQVMVKYEVEEDND